MTFFERQQQARRNTALLVALFLVAVALIVLAINVVVYATHYLTFKFSSDYSMDVLSPRGYINSGYFMMVSLATVGIIAAGSLFTRMKLRGGGAAVAKLVGAERVPRDTRDAAERRLWNVVEEMSIASGTAVPELYVLRSETSINAFVAGLRPSETALVVTQGTLDLLDRNALQGVIGHEYSHVLNGDMRINVKLMGVLAGILMIGQLGSYLLRSRMHRHRRSSDDGKTVIVMLFMGLGLLIVGYVGMFFGSLIKAAVSRQREFLADAASVQFTRNPEGIAEALWRIERHSGGTRLNNSHADDISHMCFGEPVRAAFSNALSTHPPVEKRIDAVYPGFYGERLAAVASGEDDEEWKSGPERRAAAEAQAVEDDSQPDAQAPMVPAAVSLANMAEPMAATAATLTESVGTVSPVHVGMAAVMLQSIPQALKAASHRDPGARLVVYAMLMSDMQDKDLDAARALVRNIEGDVDDELETLRKAFAKLNRRARLPLVNLAMATLKTTSRSVRGRVMKTAGELIRLDRRITLFEFALTSLLKEHLSEDAGREVTVKFHHYRELHDEIRLLLTVMARAGTTDEVTVKTHFDAAWSRISSKAIEPLPAKDCKLAALDRALDRINQLTPHRKEQVIYACAMCVIEDEKILPGEADMMQAIALRLDCPMPPLLEAFEAQQSEGASAA